MHRVDQQDLLQVLDLTRLPIGLEIRKYMAKHNLINKYPLPHLRIQLLLSLPEIAQYLPRKHIDLPLVTRQGKPLNRGEHLLIIGRYKFFQSLWDL